MKNWLEQGGHLEAFQTRGGHRHVHRINEQLPWTLANIEWRDELRPNPQRNHPVKKPEKHAGQSPAQAAVVADRLNRSVHAEEGIHILTIWQWKQAMAATD